MTEPANPAGNTPAPANDTTAQGAAPVANPTPNTPAANEPQHSAGTFTPTGHAGTDLALGFFAKLGLSEDGPELAEAAKGNFSYLEAKLGTLGEDAKGWEAYVSLAKEGYNHFTQTEQTARAERTKIAYDTVGGEEQWNAINEWVAQNGTDEEKAVFSDALRKGGVMTQMAAFFLLHQYQNASGTTVEGKDPILPNAGANVPDPASMPLDRAGYTAALNELTSKFGSQGLEQRPEYQALRKRFAASRR